jgi:MoaA/NifB/PqqE/SkfB family radical SAM enzyme
MEQKPIDFPKVVSLTVTNRCNLRCRMCAQWSEEGYMQKRQPNDSYSGTLVPFDSLLKVVDEVHEYGVPLIIRGGEPLLYPRIPDLLAHIKSKGMSLVTSGGCWMFSLTGMSIFVLIFRIMLLEMWWRVLCIRYGTRTARGNSEN